MASFSAITCLGHAVCRQKWLTRSRSPRSLETEVEGAEQPADFGPREAWLQALHPPFTCPVSLHRDSPLWASAQTPILLPFQLPPPLRSLLTQWPWSLQARWASRLLGSWLLSGVRLCQVKGSGGDTLPFLSIGRWARPSAHLAGLPSPWAMTPKIDPRLYGIYIPAGETAFKQLSPQVII